jgi:hypothetical protein
MSKVRYNGVADALQGRMGVVVFRRMLGRLYASNRPNESSKPPSATQLAHRDTFAKAAGDARDALRNPETRAVYERIALARQSTPFGVAMSDIFNPPEVLEVDLTGFTYVAGGRIKVRARDDAEVKSVDVAVRRADGTVIEQGGAEADGSYWYYTSTSTVPDGTPLMIEAKATDWASNTGVKSVNYP